MTAMSRNPEAVAEAIRKAQRIAVCSHVNPDGDTLGCATAMRLALMKLGKEVSLFCDGKVPDMLSFLPCRDADLLCPGQEGQHIGHLAVAEQGYLFAEFHQRKTHRRCASQRVSVRVHVAA